MDENQTIVDFESELNQICDSYRERLSHAELVGVLDTVKMGYHIGTYGKEEGNV